MRARGWKHERSQRTPAVTNTPSSPPSTTAPSLAFRINSVLLVPAVAASVWLSSRGEAADDAPPPWDPDSQAARWRAGNHAVAAANLLTVAEAADIIGVTPNRVYGIIRTRRMVGRVVNGRIWVDPADIADYQARYPQRVTR